MRERLKYEYGHTQRDKEKVLDKIAIVDPKLAVRISENIDFLSRLVLLTRTMKQEFYRHIDLIVFAKALRLCTPELIGGVISDVSSSIKIEMLHHIKEPRSVGEVAKSQELIIITIRELEEKGVIHLCPVACKIMV